MSGDAGDDLVLGGAAGDNLSGNTDNDIVLGDHGRVTYASGAIVRVAMNALASVRVQEEAAGECSR